MAIETKTMDDIRKFAEHKIIGLSIPVFTIVITSLIIAGICKFMLHMSDMVMYTIVTVGIMGGYVVNKKDFALFFIPKLYRYVSHTNMRNLYPMYRRAEDENSKKK
jgi:hypothetical protein